MKHHSKEDRTIHWFQIGLIFIGFIFALAFFQIVVILPRQKIETRNAELAEQKIEADKRDHCISIAQNAYSTDWDLACKSQGKYANCTLPDYVGVPLMKKLAADKLDCVTLYRR